MKNELMIRNADENDVNDFSCNYCDEKNNKVIKVVVGKINCYFCGNQINLCQKCWNKFLEQVDKKYRR
jgi:hypothetical protein